MSDGRRSRPTTRSRALAEAVVGRASEEPRGLGGSRRTESPGHVLKVADVAEAAGPELPPGSTSTRRSLARSRFVSRADKRASASTARRLSDGSATTRSSSRPSTSVGHYGGEDVHGRKAGVYRAGNLIPYDPSPYRA